MNSEAEFYQSFYEDIQEEYQKRIQDADDEKNLYREGIFTETVLHEISESGLACDDARLCQYQAVIRSGNVSLNAYAVNNDEAANPETSVLDLFVTLYNDKPELEEINASQLQPKIQQCARFYQYAKRGNVSAITDPSSEVYGLAETIRETEFGRVRIFLLTNYKISENSRTVKSREINGITYNIELVDFTRYWHYVDKGESQSDIIANLTPYGGIPCVYVTRGNYDYDCILCAIPAQILYDVYRDYGERLLEANVRSFLDQNGKINKGIRDTIRTEPQRFMAYNNGIVMTAMDVVREQQERGSCITGINGLQIVNGGQTVASIFFTKQKYKDEVDLNDIVVPAKILVPPPSDDPEEHQDFDEMFISKVSIYSNSQNKVKTADLSSNHKFHVELEKLANTTYCPDGHSRWFYERGSGKYMTTLKKQAGNNPKKLKQLKKERPTSMKFTKTEMSKYFFAWAQRPEIVSLGGEKCFARFMEALELQKDEWIPKQEDLNQDFFKTLVAKAILFNKAFGLFRNNKEDIPASPMNVATYLISLLSYKYGNRMNLLQIWKNQDLSDELKTQFKIWGKEIFDALLETAQGRQISEWAKKEDCWKIMRQKGLSEPVKKIRELH